MDRKILTVFLASPSDLSDERQEIRNAVNRLNKVIGRRLNWNIELMGWEDTLPGFARPQAIINKDVDTCDLFIGMLWKRWGQSTGEFSSGFEEEFLLARSRRLAAQKPEIWLLFKTIDENSLKDPGPQLEKTLEFQKDQVAKKELLYKSFRDVNELSKIIYDDLNAYILDLTLALQSEKVATESVPSKATKEIPENEKDRAQISEDVSSKELLDLYSQFSLHLVSGELANIDFWQRTRGLLSSTALFSASHIGELIGTHETNLIYRKRKEWHFAPFEVLFLSRNYLGSLNEVCPGWFWLGTKGEEGVDQFVLYEALHNSNDAVRRGAYLKLIDIKFQPDIRFVAESFRESNEYALRHAITLSEGCPDPHLLDLLEPFKNSSNTSIKETAFVIYASNKYLVDPEGAFNEIVQRGSKVPEIMAKTIENLSLGVSDALLMKGLKEGSPRIREFCTRYLKKRDKLSKEVCHDLLKDSDSHVRKIAFLSLLEQGESFSAEQASKLFPDPDKSNLFAVYSSEVTKDEILPFLYDKMPREQLESLIHFYWINGHDAYDALIRNYYEHMEARIRSDLDDAFELLKKSSEEQMRKDMGVATDEILSNLEGAVDYTRAKFISLALKGLLKDSKKEDIKYARRYTGKQYLGLTNDSVIELIKRYGKQEDIKILLLIARETFEETMEEAIKTAINISEDKEELINKLVSDENETIATTACKSIKHLPTEVQKGMVVNLIHSKHEKVRLASVGLMPNLYNRGETEGLLDEYTSRDTYFYNVVYYLDCLLYAPIKYMMPCFDKLNESAHT